MPNNTRLYYENNLRNHFTPEQWCALWYEGKLKNHFYNGRSTSYDDFTIYLLEGDNSTHGGIALFN